MSEAGPHRSRRGSATGSSGRSACAPTARPSTRSSTDDYEEFDHDPWVEPGFTREPGGRGRSQVVIVGGGFAGMLTAIGPARAGHHRLPHRRQGRRLRRHLVLEPLPRLHVRRRVATSTSRCWRRPATARRMRYAPATEIFEHCQRIGRHFDLYPHALFQTEIDTAEWDEAAVALAGHHLPRRPAVRPVPHHRRRHPAQGQAARPSRASPTSPAGRSTPPAGTTATPAAAPPSPWTGWPTSGSASSAPAPRRSRSCRSSPGPPRRSTSSSARPRRWACGPTRRSTASGSTPRSRAGSVERMLNFTAAVTGEQPEREPGGRRLDQACCGRTPSPRPPRPRRPPSSSRPTSRSWSRCGTASTRSIDDPETAEKLKPWYGKHCKRLCFHDEYLAGVQPAQRAPRRHRRPRRAAGHRRGPGRRRHAVRARPARLRLGLRGDHRAGEPARLRPGRPRRRAAQRAVGRRRPHAARRAHQRVPQPAGLPLHPGRVRPQLPPLPERARPPT